VGYKKHTLRLWLANYKASILLVPLISWAAPANRNETIFLRPSLQYCKDQLQWLPNWTVGDMAYISLPIQRRIREELNVAFVTRFRSDMHLVAPYTGTGVPRCAHGQHLEWLGYDAESQQQWFGPKPPGELCAWCWDRTVCPQEFAYASKDHEILLGMVPQASWLAQHLISKVRPWIEPAQSYEKNQLGLSHFFLNSLQLAWVMMLLADAAVLLRAHALLNAPSTLLPLGQLTPQQLVFDWT